MSHTENQSESLKFQNDYPEDEIELIDLLRVIWKWKHLIVGGAVLCAVAVFVISSMLPKVYKIETLIQPGILSFSDDGKSTYIDTPDNIKALIEAGEFDSRILNDLAESYGPSTVDELKINVTLPKGSNSLVINIETSQIEQGIETLDLLGKFLIEKYSNFVEYFKNIVDIDLNIAKAEIQKINSIKHSTEVNLNIIDKRIHGLQTGLVAVKENTNYLKKERNKLLAKKQNESNILSAILYSNTIQQNLQLENKYETEIKNLKLRKENELQNISKLENETQRQYASIEGLDLKKKNIQNVKIILKPYSSPFPIKPKKMFNVILATLIGIFLMVFLSFFLEYLSKLKRS